MHKMFAMLRGFKIRNISMRGHDGEKNQTLDYFNQERTYHSFGPDGDGYGKGKNSLANGDGSWILTIQSFEESNA